MTDNRRFIDNAKYDQMHAHALEILKKSDSFILFDFDVENQQTEVISAVAVADIPYALQALDAQTRRLTLDAFKALLKHMDEDE